MEIGKCCESEIRFFSRFQFHERKIQGRRTTQRISRVRHQSNGSTEEHHIHTRANFIESASLAHTEHTSKRNEWEKCERKLDCVSVRQ